MMWCGILRIVRADVRGARTARLVYKGALYVVREARSDVRTAKSNLAIKYYFAFSSRSAVLADAEEANNKVL